jgi:membrane fusion protein (multidrug efflux system)
MKAMAPLKRKIIIGLGLLALAGGISYRLIPHGGPPGFGGGPMPATPVKAITITTQPWHEVVTATGTLVALRGVDIKSEVAGKVTHVLFTPGQAVAAEDPLIEINPEIVKAELQQALAQYRYSENNYKRFRELYAQQVGSLQEMDQAHSDRDANYALGQKLLAQLKQLTIRAPFAGHVGLAKVELGDYVNVGDMVTNVQVLNPLRVEFNLPESYAGRVQMKTSIDLHNDAFADQTFKGEVYAIDTKVDQATRSQAMWAKVKNDQKLLIPGMFVQIQLPITTEMAMVVPTIAVSYDVQGPFVYRIEKNHVKHVAVQLGSRLGDVVRVLAGLKPGDQIVSAGQIKISDGQEVHVIAEQKK